VSEKQPHTPPRQIRIPDEDWAAFDVAAKSMDSDRATVVREFIRWYLRRPGARLPDRPPLDSAGVSA
jgi:hypothetical protein